MDWGTVLGGIAAILSVLAGLGATIAKRQTDNQNRSAERETSQLDLTLTAMNGHIATLSSENKTQREEMVSLRAEVKAAREETLRCEADKEQLKRRVADLEREVRSGGR